MTPYFNTTSVHVNKSKVDILADSVCIIYELKSVIIHTGTPEFGHYIALARPYPDIDPEKWLQLDDSRVTYITHQQMCDIAFGGGSYIVPGMPDNASTNAYMLLYEKK